MKSSFVFLILTLNTVFLSAQLKDKDNKSYKTVIIKNQEWMAENLRCTKLNDGKAIAFAKNSDEWMNYCKKKVPCYCYYQFDEQYKDDGFIYNFYASHHNKITPEGWIIPTDDAWTDLVFSVGKYDSTTAKKLAFNSGWSNNGNLINKTGFSAKPNGYLKQCGNFVDINYKTVSFWSIYPEEERFGKNACNFSVSERDGVMRLSHGFSGNTAGSYIRCCRNLKAVDKNDYIDK
jgi:uncharacterized protein (TIGR02145 family)